MLAYDHAPFIRQAIDGVLAQLTDFTIELIIADDASRDGTTAIAGERELERPDVIRLLRSERNVGMQQNLLRALKAARGRYIAFCEADDYWCHSQKLARQVAYLDSHSDVSLVFHDVQLVDRNGQLIVSSSLDRDPGQGRSRVYSPEALAVSAYIPTVSAMFRNTGTLLRAHFATVHNLDTYVFAMLGEYGQAHEIPGVMAAYRLHTGGVWSSLSSPERAMSKCWTYRAMALDIDPNRVPCVVAALRTMAPRAILMALRSGSAAQFRRMFLAYVAAVIAPFRQRTVGAAFQSLASAAYPFVWASSAIVRRLRRQRPTPGRT
jgi:hypothetical protein